MSSITVHSAQQPISSSSHSASLMATLQLWMDRRHQRQQLAQLDARQLRDIGLDAQQVQSEVQRPFWR